MGQVINLILDIEFIYQADDSTLAIELRDKFQMLKISQNIILFKKKDVIIIIKKEIVLLIFSYIAIKNKIKFESIKFPPL